MSQPILVEVEGIDQPLEFPQGTDPAVIQRTVKNLLAQNQPSNTELSKAVKTGDQYQVGGPVMGNMEATAKGIGSYIEPVMTMGSSVVAEPVAGVTGLVTAPFVGSNRASQLIDATRENFTYEPRMQESQENLQSVGQAVQPLVEPIAEGIQYGADTVYDLTGSPLAGALAKAAPAAALEYLGLKGVSRMTGGVRMLDKAGKPTRELKVLLNKKGLTFEDLTPETRVLIPPVADRKALLSTGQKKLTSDLQAKQLSTGGREKSLAPYEMVNGKVKTNAMFKDAIDKGWRESTVQMVKTSNKETRAVMRDMLSKRWRMLQSDSNAGSLFPLNAVGDSFMDRITFIGDKARQARKDLDRIAKSSQFANTVIDVKPVLKNLRESLDNLKISYVPDDVGGIKLSFKGSIIQENPAAQNVINRALRLMSPDRPATAESLHALKRQLDSLIDFQKKSQRGLSEEGRNVLKGIRHTVNKQLRDKFEDYAQVNDVLSASLDAMDEFKRATGVDIHFLEDPASAIGQEMRKLHTNYKKRDFISQAANKVDALAAELGGNFKTNYNDLTMFANRMDEVFGASKSGSFQGLSEVATAYATEGGPGAIRATGRAAKDAYKKYRNKDMFPSFISMDDLLK